MKRILPPTWLLIAIAAMVVLHFVISLYRLRTPALRLIGFIPLVIGGLMNIISDQAFKKQGTTVKPYETSRALVTDGLFRYTRNPMYLGMILILFGIAMLLGTLLPFAVVVLFAVLMLRGYIIPEERLLEETFGDRFRQYRSHVRRWI